MNLSEKILYLRKDSGLSQEELAEKLNVSRQAVSRWENGSAMPDASNLLQLSRLFGVSADYLLDDEHAGESPTNARPAPDRKGMTQFTLYMLVLEVMILLAQFMTVVILESLFFGVLTTLLFVALIGGFEYAHRKNGGSAPLFRKRFYKMTAWLGLYFPLRLAMTAIVPHWPRNVFEAVTAVIYLGTALYVTLTIEEKL